MKCDLQENAMFRTRFKEQDIPVSYYQQTEAGWKKMA